ncbi:ArsR family transcriptional regulator [Thermanaeromonas toyohensis ToBE]|uniref:ArsR family transcriptional regulator n=1 Tax=Thermanaeromonas toyohensis ToBE TaxID=698762 RepID=A0A1W1VUD1_9FIRM|nr:metalloregulator ArsR/SmtB family transcription factor [Thermanaeromonas toyohensis]SMB96975.1 ArsR family transcriptional regulator [Thermanaeromonas toyohensis ToBE]
MERLIEYLKVLADPTRMKIIKFLLERDMYVCELVAVMDIAQPTVSQHLRRLKAVGLAEEKKEGQRVRYRVNKEVLAECQRELEIFLATPIKDIPQMKEEWERFEALVASGKVLSSCPPPIEDTHNDLA